MLQQQWQMTLMVNPAECASVHDELEEQEENTIGIGSGGTDA